jgi:corrinoid protein of di/trimethylamine methyltransferase
MTEKEDILRKLREGVINFDKEQVVEAAKRALDVSIPPLEAILDGLAAGMETVGELYEKKEYFVPELMMCSEALYAGLDILKPHVKAEDVKVRGSIVLGVVEGDVHDIGKNIIKMMFDISGFTVHDLGRDVPLDKFVEKQLETGSDIVALSAMMTTTMGGIREVVKKIREKNPSCKILVGGAPLTEEIAREYGADAYGKDAKDSIQQAIRLISELKKEIKAKE